MLDYLENDSPTENSIISCIIQEPCRADRLISKEGFEISSISLITHKDPSKPLFFFFNKAGLRM